MSRLRLFVFAAPLDCATGGNAAELLRAVTSSMDRNSWGPGGVPR